MTFLEQITNYSRSGYPYLIIETHEEQRLENDLKKFVLNSEHFSKAFFTWDNCQGLQKYTSTTDVTTYQKETITPLSFMSYLIDNKVKDENCVFLVKDFHHSFKDAKVLRLIKNTAHILKAKAQMIIFCVPSIDLPSDIVKDVQVVEYKMPTTEDLLERLTFIQKSAERGDRKYPITAEIREKIINAARGLTFFEAENIFSFSLVTHKAFNEKFVHTVFDEKIKNLKKESMLEYIPTNTGFECVGGYDALKNFVIGSKVCYTEEAQRLGAKYPKGVLLSGVSGSGKTLFGKCIAKEFDAPLFKLDVGSLYNSLLGSSEANMRRVLKTIDAFDFMVLLIDEVEKSFSKTNILGHNASSASGNMFATLLNWMNDRNNKCFIVATCNNHTLLPEEFKRPGRFDACFWMDIPDIEERKAIWSVLLKKVPYLSDDIDIEELVLKTENFVGAEIESVIDGAIKIAVQNKLKKVEMSNLRESLKFVIPASRHESELLKALRDEAQLYMRSAKTLDPVTELLREVRSIDVDNE